MSHADPGPLAAYNSLQDKHLAGYFSNTRIKKHLQKSGLVTRKGKIIDEKTYRLNMAKKEHRKHVRDLLATAIVHKTLDMERIRQYEIRKRLDEIYKVELVRRVKDGRNRKGDEDILPLLSPRERTARQMRKAQLRDRPSTAPATMADHNEEEQGDLKPSEIYYDDDTQKIYYRVDSNSPALNGYTKDETEELGPSPYTRAYPATYPAPAPPPKGTPRRSRTAGSTKRGVKLQRYHYLARTEPAVARRVQLQSLAEVTMKFLGPSLVLTNSMFPEDRLSEVMVLQQHCGGSTLCVFRELLPPNTIFTFISRRHRGSPFGLTFYIDGLQDIRLSCCCEYKHKPGHIMGGKNGHFQFVVVEGAAPCYRCQIASAHRHSRRHRAADETDRSKTFMTETANEQEEEGQGETFDVIITKINPELGGDQEDGGEETDGGGMVDISTQTPRDENSAQDKEMIVDDEKNTEEKNPADEGGVEGEESGADKYDDDEFEEAADKEKDNEEESDSKEEVDKEDDKNDSDDEQYNEDFESDGEKENGKSDSDSEEDKESEKGEEEPEDDIEDETEEKEATDTGKQEEDAEEVEDETDKDNNHDAGRPASATDSEGRQGKNVWFDEDVTVIEDDQDGEKGEGDEETPDEVPDNEETPNEEEPGTNTAEQEEEEAEDVPESLDQEREDGGTKHANQEHDEDDRQDRNDTIKSPELSDRSSSSSSSSSSESSDSEDEEEREDKSTEERKVKSESDQDPGSDPDLVSSGQLPDQALKAVGVQPGTKHQGSVRSLLEGKEDVDIAGVELTKEQVEEVASIIDSREELGSIILRNASLDDKMLGILAPSLKNRLDLKMLNLGVNAFGPEGAKHLAEVIRENNSIKMLLLHGNMLHDEGVGILVDAILETTGTAIMNLDLGGCRITKDGAEHIARLIECNQTVSMLTISGNRIDLEGWKRISKALTTNSTIETISLDFNELGDEEAIALAEGIQGCTSLSYIDMEGNKIGDEGALKLVEAAKTNKSVVDLTLLPMNHISKEITDEIKQFLTERENDGKNNARRKEDSFEVSLVAEGDSEQEREESAHEREGEEDKREDEETKGEREEDKEEGEEDKQGGEENKQDGEGEKQDDEEKHAEEGEVQAEQGEGENNNKGQQPPDGDQLKESNHPAPVKEGEGNPEEQEPAAPEADQPSSELTAGEQGVTKDNVDEQQNDPGESSEKETSRENPPEQEPPKGGQPEAQKDDATPQDLGEPLNQTMSDEETRKAHSSTERDAKDQEELRKDNDEDKEPAADSV